PREVAHQAARLEPAEPAVGFLDDLDRRLRRGPVAGAPAGHPNLKRGPHRGGGRRDAGWAGHSFPARIVLASKPKAEPSRSERVARAPITMPFAPSSTGLADGPLLRIAPSQCNRRASWSSPWSSPLTIFSSVSSAKIRSGRNTSFGPARYRFPLWPRI